MWIDLLFLGLGGLIVIRFFRLSLRRLNAINFLNRVRLIFIHPLIHLIDIHLALTLICINLTPIILLIVRHILTILWATSIVHLDNILTFKGRGNTLLFKNLVFECGSDTLQVFQIHPLNGIEQTGLMVIGLLISSNIVLNRNNTVKTFWLLLVNRICWLLRRWDFLILFTLSKEFIVNFNLAIWIITLNTLAFVVIRKLMPTFGLSH